MRSLIVMLATLLAPAAALAADPAPVTVRVVSQPDGRPVVGVISVRTNGTPVSGSFPTGADGWRTLPDIICTPAVEVRVRPQNSDFSSDGRWRPCGPNPIEYPMRPRSSTIVVRSYTGLPSQFQADHNALLAAMDSDDSRVADLSRDMAAKLRAAGRPQDALAYTAVSIEAEAEALRALDVDVPEEAVRWDAAQKAFVQTPDMLKALTAFQKENSISASGQWDMVTARAIDRLQMQRLGDTY